MLQIEASDWLSSMMTIREVQDVQKSCNNRDLQRTWEKDERKTFVPPFRMDP